MGPGKGEGGTGGQGFKQKDYEYQNKCSHNAASFEVIQPDWHDLHHSVVLEIGIKGDDSLVAIVQ